MDKLVVLSHFQAAVLLRHRESIGNPIDVSLDLNISFQQGVIMSGGVELEGIGVLQYHSKGLSSTLSVPPSKLQ